MELGWGLAVSQVRLGRVERAGVKLGGGDQEGKASSGGQEAGGGWEDASEALDGAEGYYVEGGWGKGFGAGVLYIDVRQCKGAG